MTIHTIIKNSLPKPLWNEVITALKHDVLVWNYLQDRDVIDTLKDFELTDLEDWLPVNLGLLSLNLPLNIKDFQTKKSALLDDDIFNKALNKLEESKDGQVFQNFIEALIVALAIREKHYLGESWQSIRKELGAVDFNNLRTIMICLFGIISDPLDFLGDFAHGKFQSENYRLILDTLLSNPIGIELRTDILIEIISNDWYIFSPSLLDHINAIQYLSIASPHLGRELSNKLLNIGTMWMNTGSFTRGGIADNLQNLENLLMKSNLVKLTDDQNIEDTTSSQIYKLFLDLYIQFTQAYQKIDSKQELNTVDITNGVTQAYRSIFTEETLINHPKYLQISLIEFLSNHEYDQAKEFILNHDGEIFSAFLTNVGFAMSSFKEGNIQEALLNSRSAIDNLTADDHEIIELLEDNHENILYDFINLLFDIDLYQEANKLSQRMLSLSPGDINLYLILGDASVREFSPESALNWFQEAILLEPENLDIRRRFAFCLEKIANWSEAYEERKYIFEEISDTESSQKLSDLYALTECAIEVGNLDEANELCKQADNLGEVNGYTRTLIGKILSKQGDFEGALEQFDKGIELSPDIPNTWIALVNSQLQMGDPSNALETLQTAAQALPTSTEILLSLGELQLSQNAITDALATFKRGTEIDPNNTILALKLGATLRKLRHIDEAKQILSSAHLRKPNHIETAYEYAKALIDSGEMRAAIPILEIVVNSRSKDVRPYLEYAEAVLSTGSISEETRDSDQIINVLQRVIELEPNNSIAHALLGESYIAKGEFLFAKQAYQIALESELVENEEWFARLSLGMGKVALALGQEDVALASLQEAVQADPNNPLIHRSLSEVYQAVNLFDNALQAARAALNLAVDDVDTLSWYADQMLLISENDHHKKNDLFSNEILKQVQIEALNALHQAIQISPENSSLVVKLGKLQSLTGDKESAIKTLYRMIDNDYAGPEELAEAGKLLAELGDNCGAITCLELASNLNSEPSISLNSTLMLELAKLYKLERDYQASIEALNNAQTMDPTSVTIYITKAMVLFELNNEDEAESCIIEGLENTPKDENQILLYLLASSLYRRNGELKKALEYSQNGLSLCSIDSLKNDQNISIIRDTVTFTVELYRAILKPNRGRYTLKDMERKLRVDFTDDIDYCCTYLELFLYTIDENSLTSQISRLVEQNPDHPRILALQSRILNRRGDYQTAVQILHSALDSANQQVWDSRINQYKNIFFPSIHYSIIDCALELNQWEIALFIVRKLLENVPEEPRALINLAKTLVMRAEHQQLCEVVGITTHAPGPSALSTESRSEFEAAITDVIRKLSNFDVDSSKSETRSGIQNINPTINRWHARGLVIFGDDEEIEAGIGDLIINSDHNDGDKSHLNTDDIASLIAAENRLGSLNEDVHLSKLINTTRAFPLATKLHMQAAIAMSEVKPIEAINILNQLNEIIVNKESPDRAIVNAYLAQIALQIDQIENAKSPIDTALDIWPNEPRWQILAAKIYQKLGNIADAIHHLDEAINIEPQNLENHLELGKLLIEYSGLDPTYSKRATQVLERGCRLKPDAPEPWVYLSRAYLNAMEMEQAVSCADMAVSLAPESIETLVLRGEVALHQEDPTTALDYAKRVLSINNNDHQAILIQSQALRDLDRQNEALNILESAMEKMDDPIKLHVEYAILLNDVRGPQASIDALDAIAIQHPDNPTILGLLAKNLAEMEQIDSAIQTAQKAIQVSNGSLQVREKADLHFLLGKLLSNIRQLDQAIHHLSESIALVPNYVDPYLELGHTHQEQRQYRKALEVYQKATQIAPNDPRPHYHAGIVLKEGKDYQSSESMLRRAADLAPEDVNIRRQLAAVVALNLVHNPRSTRIFEE